MSGSHGVRVSKILFVYTVKYYMIYVCCNAGAGVPEISLHTLSKKVLSQNESRSWRKSLVIRSKVPELKYRWSACSFVVCMVRAKTMERQALLLENGGGDTDNGSLMERHASVLDTVSNRTSGEVGNEESDQDDERHPHALP